MRRYCGTILFYAPVATFPEIKSSFPFSMAIIFLIIGINKYLHYQVKWYQKWSLALHHVNANACITVFWYVIAIHAVTDVHPHARLTLALREIRAEISRKSVTSGLTWRSMDHISLKYLHRNHPISLNVGYHRIFLNFEQFLRLLLLYCLRFFLVAFYDFTKSYLAPIRPYN